MVAGLLARLARRAARRAVGPRAPVRGRSTTRGLPRRSLSLRSPRRQRGCPRRRRDAVTPAGRPLLTGFSLFVVAAVLSLLPGWLPGALAGAVLALFLPGYALLLCLGAAPRIDRLTDV